MQVRGRHRALPYELDRAILLPKDQRDADMTSIRRRGSSMSIATRPVGFSTATRMPSQAISDD